MEFSVHVGLAVAAAAAALPPPPQPSSTTAPKLAPEPKHSRQGTLLSSAGPGALPAGGSILEDPDLVWTEDRWTEEDEQQSLQRVQQQGEACTPFWRQKYVTSAGANWHAFYQRNTNRFYKDRHYLHVAFPELAPPPVGDSDGIDGYPRLDLLEVGCGVGNAVFPLLRLHPGLRVTALDHAKSAIAILNETAIEQGLSERITGRQCDVTRDTLPPEGSMDIVLCMFVLSAIPPEQHASVVRRLAQTLRPGGKLLFRDYGRFDEAQLRFRRGSKLSEHFYVRQDGTCSFFFQEQELTELINGCQGQGIGEAKGQGRRWGMATEECYAITRQYANRKQQAARRRVWIHAKAVKILLPGEEDKGTI